MADLNALPKFGIFQFVIIVEKVDIKSTVVAKDFFDAEVAPMVGRVPNGVTVGAIITMMILVRLKLRLVELLDELHIPERCLLHYVFDLSVDVCHGYLCRLCVLGVNFF